MAKITIGTEVVITKSGGHPFTQGDRVTVFRVFNDGSFDCYRKGDGEAWRMQADQLQIANNSTMKLMKQAVLDTANKLCQANNTVTTLEIKTELRKTHPYFHWIQNSRNGLTGVSEYMDELYQEGHFVYTDNGQYRVYSAVTVVNTPTAKRGRPRKNVIITPGNSARVTKNPNHNIRSISRQKALDMMANNKGHFFTAVFVKQNGDERTINCQYLKDQSSNPLGYVMVREAQKMKDGVNAIRQINLQTLRKLRIGGQDYNIRKS